MRYLVLILLTACIGQHEGARCRRAQRHVIAATEMCPDLLKNNVITIRDTFITPPTYIDTTIYKDSIMYVDKDKWHVIIKWLPGDSVRVFIKADADTSIHEKKAPCPPSVTVRKPTIGEELMSLKGLFWLILIILSVCGGLYLRGLFKK